MAIISPQQAADKLKQRISTGQTAYSQGIDRVTENPATLAIAQKDKMVANWNKAITDGKWEQGLGRVTLSSWKTAAKGKGASNYAASADRAATNYQQFANEFFPYAENIANQVKAMPSLTLQQNIQRAVFNMEQLAKFKRTS